MERDEGDRDGLEAERTKLERIAVAFSTLGRSLLLASLFAFEDGC